MAAAAVAVRAHARYIRPQPISFAAARTPRRYSLPADTPASMRPGQNVFCIAIDGPAASGKSSTARTVAMRLGFRYVDTGAMYRSITLLAMRAKIHASAEQHTDELCRMTTDARFDFSLTPAADASASSFQPPQLRVAVNGEDVTERIRDPDVTRGVAVIAKQPAVRTIMLQKQRALALRDSSTTASSSSVQSNGLVIDGRDIGSVVFPNAELKIFLTAQLRVRAERRMQEYLARGLYPTEEERAAALRRLMEEIQERDRLDEQRTVSPLVKANDAVLIDTSALTLPEQVCEIERLARARMI